MSNKLIGTKPNQVPTNSDLGEMAYQNNDDVTLAAASKSSLTVKRKDDDGDLVKLKRDVTTAGQLGVYASGTGAYLNGTSLLSLRIAGGDMLTLTNSNLYPTSDSGVNLGLSNRHFNNFHMSGTAYIDGGIESASYSHLDDLPDVRPSLLLDFANSKTLDPRITFTRGSTATYYDGYSTVKGPENLFGYTEDFSNSEWSVSGATKTSTTATDPAGGSTALQLTFNSDNSYSLRQYTASQINSANKTVSLSMYLKGTAGETVKLYLDNGVNQGFTQDVTLTADWVRYSMVNKTFNSTNARITAGVRRTSTETADEVYVAFPQVEIRSTITSYTPNSSAQPLTKYHPKLITAVANEARFDHDSVTNESKGLLIEDSRTNLVTYSEGTSGWTLYNNGSLTNNRAIAPDGSQAAQVINHDGGTGVLRINTSALTNGTTYTMSVYIKSNNSDTPSVNLQIGDTTVVSGQALTNEWVRYSGSGTPAVTGYNFLDIEIPSGSDISIWGAQVETGSFPTSYIPTSGSTVTRDDDNVLFEGISSVVKGDEGTFFADYIQGGATGGQDYVFRAISESGHGLAVFFDTPLIYGTNYGVNNSGFLNVTADAKKVALVYSQSEGLYRHYANGSAGSDDDQTFTSFYAPEDLILGGLGASSGKSQMYIKKFAFYPKRLSNATLQAMTEE